jgi:hypothetical protein
LIDDLWWAAATALVAGAAVLVLPGLALLEGWRRWRRWRRDESPVEGAGDVLAAALALSLCAVGLVGVVLIGARSLSTGSMGVAVGALALLGAVPAVAAVRRTRPQHVVPVALVVAAAAPLTLSVLDGGYRPAQSYQWFYWGLGRQLSVAGGVPEHVLEWGRQVRWQPDYLEFNLLTQAFLGLTPHLEDPTAVAAWRLPTTLLVVAAVLVVLRLWFPLLPAVAGTLAFGATTFFVETVGNNSPEALGLAFGLAAVRLAVRGIRTDRPSLVVLAAVTLALDVSVHGIAAAVCGLLLVACLAVEVLTRPGGLGHWVPRLGLAGVAGLVVLLAQGVAVQGRSSPLRDAANPARTTGGTDPTFDFVQFSNGRFDEPVRRTPLRDALLAPLPGDGLASWQWGWLVGLALVGLVAAVLRRRTTGARGVQVSLLLAALLGVVALVFQLRYDTYVPRHTGNARIAGYFPLVPAVWVAHGVVVLGALLARWRVPERLVAGAAVVLLLVLTAPLTHATMAGRPVLRGDGAEALAWVRDTLPPGSRVVSNVATRGTLEFFTGAENPLEGRQPLIEEPGFLRAAVSTLVEVHDYLEQPRPGGLEELGADYLVLARPPQLGSVLQYAVPASGFARRAGLETVWERGTVRVLAGPNPPVVVDPVGPARALGGRVAGALAAVLLVLGGVARVLRRLGSPQASHEA